MTIHILLLAGALGLVGWAIGVPVVRCVANGCSLVGALSGSTTIVWARLKLAAGAVLGAAVTIGDYMATPAIRDAIQSLVPPESVPVYLVGIAVVTEILRRRSLGKGG